MVGRHLLLEALFTLVGGRNAGLDVRNVNLALVAYGLGQCPRGDLAAQNVVRGNIGQWEIRLPGAGLVDAAADEGVDSDHRNAGIIGLAQRLDQLNLVGRRDQDRVRLLGDDRVKHGDLRYRIEIRGTLENQGHTKSIGCRLGSLAHGDVKTVGGETRNERNGELLVLRQSGRDQRRCADGESRQGGNNLLHNILLMVWADLPLRSTLKWLSIRSGYVKCWRRETGFACLLLWAAFLPSAPQSLDQPVETDRPDAQSHSWPPQDAGNSAARRACVPSRKVVTLC